MGNFDGAQGADAGGAFGGVRWRELEGALTAHIMQTPRDHGARVGVKVFDRHGNPMGGGVIGSMKYSSTSRGIRAQLSPFACKGVVKVGFFGGLTVPGGRFQRQLDQQQRTMIHHDRPGASFGTA